MHKLLAALAILSASTVTTATGPYPWIAPTYEPPLGVKPRKVAKNGHKVNQRKQKGKRK